MQAVGAKRAQREKEKASEKRRRAAALRRRREVFDAVAKVLRRSA
jgi:hypothetical protein